MNKVKQRLIQSCYIFIILIAIGLAVATYFIESENVDSYLLSLSSSCVGTVLFFLIFKFFLADSDTILLEKIDSLISEKVLHHQNTISEKEATERFFSCIKGQKVTKLYMIGYSMAHIFQQYKDELSSHCNNKTEVKVILIDPDSTAGKLMFEEVGNIEQVKEPHTRSLNYISKINALIHSDKYKIQVRKVNWVPSCTTMLASHKGNVYSMCLGINGFVLDSNIDRRLYKTVKVNYKDKEVEFIESHFDSLWKKGIEA